MSLLVGVDDYSSESDVIIIPSALDFVSQDEMLTPLGRLDKYAASENVFNRYVLSSLPRQESQQGHRMVPPEEVLGAVRSRADRLVCAVLVLHDPSWGHW